MAGLKQGDVLDDRFEVVGALGRGGMATVYLALDRLRGTQVALKVLHDHLADDPSMRRRLRREVQAAALVRHEAALVAHDLHEVGGTLALSMPYHAGATLTEHVRSAGPLSEAELRAVGTRIARALGDAHRKGVLHRDVTPNNVMLDTADDAVLTDFGLARSLDERTATATSVMGTPGYAAPETYQGQRTDPRSDLYSLGALLCFAATGRSPFGSGPPAGILAAQLAGERTPLAELRPDLPADLCATIDALLADDPDQRPPGADAVARALEEGRAVEVPEVPDTWDAADKPLIAPDPIDLPEGPWQVMLTYRRGGDVDLLAERLGVVLQLPGAPQPTEMMRHRRRFQVARTTDKATARRLADAGRLAGYNAALIDTTPRSLVERVAHRLNWLLPVVWIAYAGVGVDTLGEDGAMVLAVAMSILLPLVASQVGRAPPPELPVAFGDANLRAEAPDPARPASDVSQQVQPAPSRAEGLRARALGHLDLLLSELDADETLPAPARADLHRTATSLRRRAVDVAQTAATLEAALAATPAADDVSWVHGRLTRLDTLQRTGKEVDPAERERLEAALAAADEAEQARENIEASLTSCLAQLLEIGATATRARSALHQPVPDTARRLHEELEEQVAAVEATREELGRRQKAAMKGRATSG